MKQKPREEWEARHAATLLRERHARQQTDHAFLKLFTALDELQATIDAAREVARG